MDLSRAFNASNHELHCVESFRIWSFSGPFFPVFGLSRVVCISLYSVPIRKNTDQKNSEYGHFLRSVAFS